MSSISITKVIELTFKIEGIDGYYFGSDKKLYNARTGREIKATLNGRSKGFWIKRKFYSLNKLRPMLRNIEKESAPF